MFHYLTHTVLSALVAAVKESSLEIRYVRTAAALDLPNIVNDSGGIVDVRIDSYVEAGGFRR